jgi:hypothetical protein
VNIEDAIDVIESVSGFTDESTPVGGAWAEVLSFIHRPAALAQPEPVVPTDERITSIAKAVQECAYAWEPDARLIGNVCAEDIADLCSAVLVRWGTPANTTGGTH